MIPTEEIYEYFFGWTNVPYSEAADNIGYGSRVFIENTGSMLIYFLIILVEQLVVALLLKFSCSEKIRNFA